MAFDYADLRDSVAQPLIAEFGSSQFLLVPGAPTGPAYDPQPGEDVPVPVALVETTFTKEEMAGGNVQKDDVAYIASTQGVTVDPELAERLQVENVIYQIVKIKPLRPGAVVLLWKVHARK